jgi:hypothetical protein
MANDDGTSCKSKRTVQLGPLAAVDLQCIHVKSMHGKRGHGTARRFGDVSITATWPGEFEED